MAPDPVLPGVHRSAAGSPLPFPSLVQRLRARGDRRPRRAARHMVDDPANRALPPIPSRRFRPGASTPGPVPTKRKGASSVELSWLNWLYTAVAQVITWIHQGYSTFLAPDSGLNWALTIITLTVLMRLLIFPLFLKQMRSSKKMQELAPKVAGAAQAVQERQAAHEPGGHGALPGGGRQPARRLPADRGAVPDLHLDVHRAAGHGRRPAQVRHDAGARRQRPGGAHLRRPAAGDLLHQRRPTSRSWAPTRSTTKIVLGDLRGDQLADHVPHRPAERDPLDGRRCRTTRWRSSRRS